mgnify:CR=1 FL=1
MIKVIDNFLTKSYHKELLDLMNSPDFSWYYEANITTYKLGDNPKNLKNKLNNFGFSHIFWDHNGMRDSNVAFLWKAGLYQIMDAINSNVILRSRGDMTMYTPKEKIHDPHVDFYFKNYSTIFYVNNSDGDTIYYNQRLLDKDNPIPHNLEIVDRVSPKANRVVIFEGDVIHTGCSPNKHTNRIIINSNFGVQ